MPAEGISSKTIVDRPGRLSCHSIGSDEPFLYYTLGTGKDQPATLKFLKFIKDRWGSVTISDKICTGPCCWFVICRR
jgi:hypothetical protein